MTTTEPSQMLSDLKLAQHLQEEEDKAYCISKFATKARPPELNKPEHNDVNNVNDEGITLEDAQIYEDYEEDYDPIDDFYVSKGGHSNGGSVNMKKYQPSHNRFQKFFSRIDLRPLKHNVLNQIRITDKKHTKNEIRRKDVNDRSTVENVLDHRTRMVIFKLINRNVIGSIKGCVSTGKEANVYYGVNLAKTKQFAIKIYKTSILKFRDRAKYVEGEYRFQRFSKTNPRKMVRMWAEKEMRNLKRLHTAGIKCPKVYFISQHVLGMEFIGKSGWPARLLKDTRLDERKYSKIYIQVVKIMRKMFRDAKLIHSDFSEYNMLYHKGKIYVIDVSQGVEFNHPNALMFLKMDCSNVKKYFTRKGVQGCLSIKQMFKYITEEEMKDRFIHDCIKENIENGGDNSTDDDIDDLVFKKGFTPQNISEVSEVTFDTFKKAFLKEKKEEEEEEEGEEEEELGEDDIEIVEVKHEDDEKVKVKNKKREKKEEEKQKRIEKMRKKEEEKLKKDEEKKEENPSKKEEEEKKESSEGKGEEGEGEGEVNILDSIVDVKDIAQHLRNLGKRERKKLMKEMKKEKRKTKVKKHIKKRRKRMAKKGNKKIK